MSKRRIPNAAGPLITGHYTEEQIKEFNQRHDQSLGWSINCETIYTNPKRNSETYIGPIKNIWDRPQSTNP